LPCIQPQSNAFLGDYLVHAPEPRLSSYFPSLLWAVLCQKAHQAVVVITSKLWLNENSPERIGARHLEMEEAEDEDNVLKSVGDTFFKGSPLQEGLNTFTGAQVAVEEDNVLMDIRHV
jgi:hypothetical protein